MKYCPRCASDLILKPCGNQQRLACSSASCSYVFWDNPVPVAAIIVEQDEEIILANNKEWPQGIYSIITGFVERGELPLATAVREVEEELGLEAEMTGLVGIYSFPLMNQIIIAYHAHGHGHVRLGTELRACKRVHKTKLRPWNAATGHAVRDWLQNQGLYDGVESSPPAVAHRGVLYRRIDAVVRCIPRGEVASYGQIAKLVGACSARQVGYAMAALAEDSDVPWHRVINSQGRISIRSGSGDNGLQRLLLAAEGVRFDDNQRVDLGTYRWQPPASVRGHG